MIAREIRLWLYAVLIVAAILALTARSLKATDECEGDDPGEDCLIVYYPGICHYLEPGSYWYEVFLCGDLEAEGLMAESVTYSDRRVRIDRLYEGGRHVILIAEIPRRQR